MSPDRHARTMLPIPDRPAPGLMTYDAKDPDTAFPPIEPLLPPAGAPNVLIVLLDDVGFGAASTFGGPCRTPTADRLAAGGLRYNRFHTTALCAPTRAALLSGRNHHSVGMGSITETATSAPGNSSLRPNTKAPLAMTLKLNGYSTAQFGKCHEVPVWQSSPMGPFDAWPSGGGGFETFYGFIGGENNQWDPALYDGTTPVEPPATAEEGYHLTEDLADRADQLGAPAEGVDARQAVLRLLRPRRDPRPAPRAQGVGRQVRRASSTTGGTCQRERTFARQKELGVIPADAELTVRHAEITAWDDMPDELKPVLARQMEVYAGFLEHTDHHVGRLIDAIEDLGILDDTIIYYIIGDNGASAEGTINGAFNEMANFNGMAALETPEFLISKMDELGRRARTTTTPSGGRGRTAPRSSGPSRSPRTGAAPATGPSCTGPTGSKSGADSGPSSPTSSTSPRRSSKRPGCQSRRWSTGCCSRRWRAPACSTRSTRALRRNVTTCSTSRCSPTAASTTRAGARSPSTAPRGSWSAATCRRSTTTCGSSTTAPATTARPTTLPPSNPRSWPLQRLWLIEAAKYNVLPLDEERDELYIKAARGLREEVVCGTRIRMGESVAGWVAEHGAPLLVTDIEEDPRFGRRNGHRSRPSRSYRSRSRWTGVVGVININNKVSCTPFTEDDQALLSSLADRVARAWQHAAAVWRRCGHEPTLRAGRYWSASTPTRLWACINSGCRKGRRHTGAETLDTVPARRVLNRSVI